MNPRAIRMNSPISYAQFGRLRLRRFLPASARIVEHDGFEWMHGLWCYEGIGFTWFGRLETSRHITSGLELYFQEISKVGAKRILATLGVSVYPNMRMTELTKLLGKPQDTLIFASDRKTPVFEIGARHKYQLSCTVHNRRGLIHMSIIRSDVLKALESAASA
jgi:hypothetical protein